MAVAKPGSARSVRTHRVASAAPADTVVPTSELHTIATHPPATPADDAELPADTVAVSPEAEAATEPHMAELHIAEPQDEAVAPDDADLTDDPLAALPLSDDPDLAALAADPALEEEDLADEDVETIAPVEEEDAEEEEDDSLPRPSNRVAPRMPGHMPGVPNRPIMHARMPAKAEVFQEGDHVVYPTHGVGKVERIATEEIAGHKLELIHITFEENRMTLRVPVSKARSAGLRKLASRKMFDDAMAILKGRARIKRTMWSRRAQEYEAKINSGDPLAIAEVVRDLHRNSGQPDQSFSERQIYEAAMDRLAAELAALDKTDKVTAVTKLGDFLKTV